MLQFKLYNTRMSRRNYFPILAACFILGMIFTVFSNKYLQTRDILKAKQDGSININDPLLKIITVNPKCENLVFEDPFKDFVYVDKFWVDNICFENNGVGFLNFDGVKEVKPPSFSLNEDSYRNQKNIFIIDRNCKASFNGRDLCGIESIARVNPSAQVTVFKYHPEIFDEHDTLEAFEREIDNVKFSYLNLSYVMINSPFAKTNWNLLRDEEISTDDVMSGVKLRTLFEYGGTFMDLDVIAVRPLPEDPKIFQMNDEFFNSFMFLKAEKGTQSLKSLMDYWYKNDFSIVENDEMKKFLNCDSSNSESCVDWTILAGLHGVTSLTEEEKLSLFIDRSRDKSYTQILENDTFMINYRNEETQRIFTEIGSNSYFEQITKKFCPFTYQLYVDGIEFYL